jgi:phosphoribosylaminoimidazolecarboxamide formyltransferase / IMP cyclohydrolase
VAWVRALLSVTDKDGIVPFAQGLVGLGWELVATDGTAALLAEHGVPVLPTEAWTRVPVMLDGRVKTLTHGVFAALLCRGDNPGQLRETAANGVVRIDLVAGNFYRFAAPVGTHVDLLDTIDVGGPAMMRAAAKNHPWVIPIVDPGDYGWIIEALRAVGGAPDGVDLHARRDLAGKAFRLLAELDNRIADELGSHGVGHRGNDAVHNRL